MNACKEENVVEKKPKKEEKDFCDLVLGQIMRRMGKPNDLYNTRCTLISKNKYRVNIYRRLKQDTMNKGIMMPSPLFEDQIRITDSFFVSTDGSGNILVSSPDIPEMKY